METSTELNEIRIRSLARLSAAGISSVPPLPLLETGLRPRATDAVLRRLFCLHAVAAVSYGFERQNAVNWIRREELFAEMTDDEHQFLEHGHGDPRAFQAQIEGMWTLAWAISLVQRLDFWQPCEHMFAAMLPNLKVQETTERLRKNAAPREAAELIAACDLGYCLHWVIRHAQLTGGELPVRVEPYIVVERRRALEWLLTDAAWNAVSLDT